MPPSGIQRVHEMASKSFCDRAFSSVNTLFYGDEILRSSSPRAGAEQ
jgi:hypothetical protein